MSTNIFSNEIALDGSHATDRAYRKIELQSPADLTYLIAKVSRTARQKIDKHFPPDAAVQGEDRMRGRVEMLVDDYIRNTFNLAKPNLSINGMDSTEMDAELAKAQEGEEFEAFDARLVQRIQNLSTQIEAHTLELANLRRNAPTETAKRFHDAYVRQDQELDVKLQSEEEKRVARAGDTKLKMIEIERLDDIRDTWQSSSDQLRALKDGLDTTSKSMEKAQQSIEYVANS